MITTYHEEYKQLNAKQRAKVRKALSEYEAERNPIMFETNRYDDALRRQYFIDLNCEARLEEVRVRHLPRMQELREEIARLNEELKSIQEATREEDSEIKSEPYRAVYEDAKYQALRDVWQSINERHEAKMAQLLASFKAEGAVA